MCLVDHAHLEAGQRVFINGGSGGTGLWGIQVRENVYSPCASECARGGGVDLRLTEEIEQIAKALGAYVVSTCSEQSLELVIRAGADEARNRTPPLPR